MIGKDRTLLLKRWEFYPPFQGKFLQAVAKLEKFIHHKLMGKDDKARFRRSLLNSAFPPDTTRKEQKAALAAHLGRRVGVVDKYLTDGFPEHYFKPLRSFFQDRKIAFDQNDWKVNEEQGGRVRTFEDDDHARRLLFTDSFKKFLCIRPPSPRPVSVSSGALIGVNEAGLIDFEAYAEQHPPSTQLKGAWANVGKLEGISITAMGRIGAIPEVWAAAELVRSNNAQHLVKIFAVPGESFMSKDGACLPMLGARVVDGIRCQLNTPFNATRHRSQSAIIEDRVLATTLYDHASRLMQISFEISDSHLKHDIEHFFQTEYDLLSEFNPRFRTQYGNLTTFDQVRAVKDEILRLAKSKDWFPPLI